MNILHRHVLGENLLFVYNINLCSNKLSKHITLTPQQFCMHAQRSVQMLWARRFARHFRCVAVRRLPDLHLALCAAAAAWWWCSVLHIKLDFSRMRAESNYSGNSSTVADDCDRAVHALVRVCVLLQSSSLFADLWAVCSQKIGQFIYPRSVRQWW